MRVEVYFLLQACWLSARYGLYRVVGHKTNNGVNNPLQDKWKLVQYPEEYRYSSARFYEKGVDEFGLMTHYAG